MTAQALALLTLLPLLTVVLTVAIRRDTKRAADRAAWRAFGRALAEAITVGAREAADAVWEHNLRAYRMEEHAAMSILRPTDFVKITNPC